MRPAELGTRDASVQMAEVEGSGEFSGDGSFAQWMERISTAFAVTRGAGHTLVYANAAFRRLPMAAGGVVGDQRVTGRPIADVLGGAEGSRAPSVLDRAFRTGAIARDRGIEIGVAGATAWCCTVWPEMDGTGEADFLVIEIRKATESEQTLALQRDVAERMLLSALHERDVADDAKATGRRASFLASEGRRLAASLDEIVTLGAMAGMSLPFPGDWCIVDTVGDDGAMRRLALIHPDPAKQELLRELEGRWAPELGDPFGVPAALRSAQPAVIADDLEEVLVAAAHGPETLRVLRALDWGPLLTVPLIIRERLVGAITFVAGAYDHAYTAEDVQLAEDLAATSAMALDSARMHGESVALRGRAEAASAAKSAFLGTMSHELRTPLNAIGGYVELLDMELRGPLTKAQHADLARIKDNQRHLLALVTDVLNFVRVGSSGMRFNIVDLVAHEVVAASLALVDPLIVGKGLLVDDIACDDAIVARADRDKVTQILVNLFSNAVKFTPAGGRLAVACEVGNQTVLVRVTDTGIGIPRSKLEAVFEPFVQVRSGLAGRDSGVGLGLAISRDLARAMGGDLTLASEPGAGSTFTLSLPRTTPDKGDGARDR